VDGVVDASVLVVGGGAVGGVTAALMDGRVRRVAVLDANSRHAALMRDPGLELDELGSVRTVALETFSSPAELEGSFDFGLVTLKAGALDSALPPLRGRADAFVAMGNGLVHERVGRLLGDERVVAGTVELGATNVGPGRLRQTTRNPYVIGELDGTRSERIERLAEVLASTGSGVHITTNMRGQIWSKLLVNSTFSALGAVCGGLYRDVASTDAGRRAIVAVWSEGHAIGAAQGLELERVLGIEPAELAEGSQAAIDIVIDRAGDTEASMLQDLRRGLPTEVGVINGGVVERARALGRDAPLNARIVELVEGFGQGDGEPSPSFLGELAGTR
jgi:2-dehydropantoate 2-reductase